MSGLIIGSDQRQRYVYDALLERGCEVAHAAALTDRHLPFLHRADFVVLPVAFRAGRLSDGSCEVDDESLLEHLKHGASLFCGTLSGAVLDKARERDIEVISFLSDESFLVGNAMLTVEAAMPCIVSSMEQTLFGADCVVTGTGRLANAMVHVLRAFTPNIVVVGRNRLALERHAWMGTNIAHLGESWAFDGANLIVNTIPNECLQRHDLMHVEQGCLYLELASAPYAIARDEIPPHLVYRIEGGLPGRIKPKAAANLMLQVMEKYWEGS